MGGRVGGSVPLHGATAGHAMLAHGPAFLAHARPQRPCGCSVPQTRTIPTERPAIQAMNCHWRQRCRPEGWLCAARRGPKILTRKLGSTRTRPARLWAASRGTHRDQRTCCGRLPQRGVPCSTWSSLQSKQQLREFAGFVQRTAMYTLACDAKVRGECAEPRLGQVPGHWQPPRGRLACAPIRATAATAASSAQPSSCLYRGRCTPVSRPLPPAHVLAAAVAARACATQLHIYIAPRAERPRWAAACRAAASHAPGCQGPGLGSQPSHRRPNLSRCPGTSHSRS